MYAKGGKGSAVPSDSQAREKLALYVYEYLLHVGAQKSAQTFLSEIRWEKNITLGEPPGFLHSWWWCVWDWCGGLGDRAGTRGKPPTPPAAHSVFWDLYCAAPDRREACEHSSEAKAFQDYSTAAAPSPVMASMAPSDIMAAGPMAPGSFQGPPGSQLPPHNPNAPMMGPQVQPFMSPRFPGGPRPTLRMPSQPPVGLPSSQPLLPGAMDPSQRAQGHPSMGPMQRVTPPRGMAGAGPQSYGGGMRPPTNSLAGPGLPTMNMGPGVRGPWTSPSGNSIPYSSSSPSSYTVSGATRGRGCGVVDGDLSDTCPLHEQGPPGGGGPPGTPIMPSPGDSTNSSENMYTIMNPIGPGASRASFPLGPGSEGPMAAMTSMEPHHVNGSLGSGEMDGLPKSSPGGAVAGLSNAPGTPRDDGEMAAPGTFLHPFPSESVSDCVDSPPAAASGRRGLAGRPRRGGRGARARP
ncbi:Single-stranded DNA-binding protein 4 [Galemys pyrenaicus]|uniref:Single-stranded DNA-binding protein 4 n=1 Tax=Galemys pyrenaicus TaxID=202257 RepID=A0A8J6AFB7_GALPY|nr:Single-stranded DNA-binding protein 4 [Galemys pyrenaicus]